MSYNDDDDDDDDDDDNDDDDNNQSECSHPSILSSINGTGTVVFVDAEQVFKFYFCSQKLALSSLIQQ